MYKIVSILLLVSAMSEAAVHSFIPCVAEYGQVTLKKVRETLHAKVNPGEADVVGFYELIKNRQVVGYLPFYYDRNKQVIGEAYLCVTSGDDYYYVNGAAQYIKNWMPKADQTVVLKGLVNDEAVSHLILTKVNNKDVKVDFFIRSLAGNREIIKDIAILSLVPKNNL